MKVRMKLTILGDGEISVSAVATDVAGNIKPAADTSFELRADAPMLSLLLNRLAKTAKNRTLISSRMTPRLLCVEPMVI